MVETLATERASMEGVDCISSMPDVILHHILSFIPIDLAIRTSALSRRWRHVWCETPRINFCDHRRQNLIKVHDINQTLISYKAPKIKSFHLWVPEWPTELEHQIIDSWIEFAVSRNVEELFLFFNSLVDHETYRFPDSFYRSSSLQNLSVDFITIPGCTVSWKSLRTLTLDYCCSDQSLDDVLSGCPVLENLDLGYCGGVHRLDLSKSPTLTSLKITRRQSKTTTTPGSMEVVAPHLLNLYLKNTEEPCTLVDVSSLTKARLNIREDYKLYRYSDDVKVNFLQLQNMLLKMLSKLQNVEELTFDTTFLQIISLAELRGVPFPTFKVVKTLTLYTMFARSVIPGIARLLQNSPGLKKLIVHATTEPRFIEDRDLDKYLDSQGLNLDQCWRAKYEGFPSSSDLRLKYARWYSKVVASFIEMVLKNVETLETLVVVFKYLRSSRDEPWFEELLQMLPTLSDNNNVSIVLRRS